MPADHRANRDACANHDAPTTNTPSQSAQMKRLLAKMLSLVNTERAKAGKSALSFARADLLGAGQSQEMIEVYFAHQSPTLATRLTCFEARELLYACGENNRPLRHLEKAHEGLMSSPAIGPNILTARCARGDRRCARFGRQFLCHADLFTIKKTPCRSCRKNACPATNSTIRMLPAVCQDGT
jgi:hypothetical protein